RSSLWPGRAGLMPFEPDRSIDESGSSIATKLSGLWSLNPREIDVLLRLEEEPQTVCAGETVLKEGGPSPSCLIVRKGWFASESFGPTGGRASPQLHFPGDIIGFPDLSYDNALYQVVAKTSGEVCRLPRHRFGELLASQGRLAGLLLCVAMIEQIQHNDRAALHLRNYATARIALFALQTLDRLALNSRYIEDQFHCPLTQLDIGDLVGLSNVHVSRTFKQLEELRVIKRHKSFIKLRDRDRLSKLAGYVNRYDQLDFSWLPEN
ncbi:MAG: Crp/Fnr family transcriptional regulator, partial [Henriciella sp.]|uniref:Crp/Fnr family transcriptional regulator n=1 Tax=Henriciella sp. TaxID=1968823 RepID=UPI003C768FCD